MKPRVLHLITSFEVGGTERQAVELLKRIDRRRFDVRLGAVRLEGPLYPEVAALFPRIPQFPLTSFYNANAAKQLLRLRNWMISERVDILHAHDFYTGLLGAAAGRLAGVRVIACQRHMRLQIAARMNGGRASCIGWLTACSSTPKRFAITYWPAAISRRRRSSSSATARARPPSEWR